jgi:hypothetical protein
MSEKRPGGERSRIVSRTVLAVGSAFVLAAFAIDPVAAQSGPAAFCGTAMADTIKNIFTLIQFGGPLIGGVIALGATVAMPITRSADQKFQLKEARNQAVIWGLIVAPLGTLIVAFLLNNIVVGGASCGF